MNAQAFALGEDQQLGVEEPLLVLDGRQQLVRDVRADRLGRDPEVAIGEHAEEPDRVTDVAVCHRPPGRPHGQLGVVVER